MWGASRARRTSSTGTTGLPFEFTVGAGKVVKGWGEAIKVQGRRRRRRLAPDYGYGAEGSEDDVPPGATLLSAEREAAAAAAAEKKATIAAKAGAKSALAEKLANKNKKGGGKKEKKEWKPPEKKEKPAKAAKGKKGKAAAAHEAHRPRARRVAGRGRGRAVPFAHHYEAQGLLQRGGAVSGGTLEPRLPRRAAVETGGGLDFAAVVGGATVGAHIDAFEEYNLLVGESDGGAALPQSEFDSLKRKAHEVLESGRLFVTWRNLSTGMDCVNVGPHSRCFCGHSYKAHAWWENKSKKPRCRCKGCACPSFSYLPGRGAQHARCSCKHLPEDHRSARGLPAVLKLSAVADECAAPGPVCFDPARVDVDPATGARHARSPLPVGVEGFPRSEDGRRRLGADHCVRSDVPEARALREKASFLYYPSGAGGYEPHTDCRFDEAGAALGQQQGAVHRPATALLYLNGVDAGGETASAGVRPEAFGAFKGGDAARAADARGRSRPR
ncbi:hypothetical protein JL720_12503 [Aureococcus anophagefferens]|nr:hypothetical protein JL720_12503 [Aureococcus anophagefferens]